MTAAYGWTNRGAYRMLRAIFNGASLPANFYMALVTSAHTPSRTTNLFSDLTEITAGNGYTTGGYALSLNAIDFPNSFEDDTNNKAFLNVKNVRWVPSGGGIPSAGDGARYAVLTDANATIADREVWYWWNLKKDRSVILTQNLNISGAQILLYTAGTV
jgi:hypothetical protein